MAIVQFLRNTSQTMMGLKYIINYAKNDNKTTLDNGEKLVSGINCNPEFAYNEFMLTKQSAHKTDGKCFYHYCQSFHPDEKVTPKQTHEIGVELAKSFKGFEVVVGTHIEKEHIHNHLIINSVSCETGKKLHQDRASLYKLRNLSDEICLKHGLSVLPPSQPKKVKGMNHGEYSVASKGESWKFRLINTIEKSMEVSTTKADFINFMENMGYKVKWEDNRKYITYTTPGGKPCRDNKLHEEKFLKENMENEFKYREIQRVKQGQATDGFDTHNGTINDYRAEAERSSTDTRRENTIGNQVHFTTGWEDTRQFLYGNRQAPKANNKTDISNNRSDNDSTYFTNGIAQRVLSLVKSVSQIGTNAYNDTDDIVALSLLTGLAIASVYALVKILTDTPEDKITDEFVKVTIENLKEQEQVEDFDNDDQDFGDMKL